MRLTEEQQKIITSIKSVYDSIQFHGVYAKYTRGVSILAKVLKLEDPAELHYVMMHLSRLTYLKNREGRYVWGSGRYAELLGCESQADLIAHQNAEFLESYAENEFEKMETEVFRFRETASNMIDTHLMGKGQFTCHAKIYPVYDTAGDVIFSLGVLTEVAAREEMNLTPSTENHQMSDSLLSI